MNEPEHDQSADEIISEVIRRLDGMAYVSRVRARKAERPDLLWFLDYFVVMDEDPPGFDGSICIGIIKAEGTQWWRGVFTPTAKVRTGFVRTVPGDVDMALLLGEREADAILRGQPMPKDSTQTYKYGNDKILNTFIQRYLTPSRE